MKQKERIVEDLYDLTCRFADQIESTERILEDRYSPSSWEEELVRLNDCISGARDHRGFIWLANQDKFDDTVHLFEKEIAKIEDSEFEIARMKIRLLRAIASSGWQLLSESSWLPPTISKKDKMRAIGVASELLVFVQDKTGRPDAQIMEELQEPLKRFILELQGQRRTEYRGPTYRLEDAATNFVKHVCDFGLRKAKIVELLESTFSIFNTDIGHRTAQNYVDKGMER